MVELVAGSNVKKILSHLNNLYDDNPMNVDANIWIQLENGANGTIRSSQIATGEENNLELVFMVIRWFEMGKKTQIIYIIFPNNELSCIKNCSLQL